MAGVKQEMPPPGGYAAYDFFRRVKPRKIGGKWVIAGMFGWSFLGLHFHKYTYRRFISEPELENMEAHIAMEPLLLAERNRDYLKQLVINREEEKEVMKDVPGWIPGTYYGSPIFYRKGGWHDVGMEEYFAHSNYYKSYFKELMERHWH